MDMSNHSASAGGRRFITKPSLREDLRFFTRELVERHLTRHPQATFLPFTEIERYKEELSSLFYELNDRDLSFVNNLPINSYLSSQISLCLKGGNKYYPEDLRDALMENIFDHYKISIEEYINERFDEYCVDFFRAKLSDD